MKKQCWFKSLTIAVVLQMMLSVPAGLFAQAGQPVTQADFAIYIARALGIEQQLPAGATKYDYVNLLEDEGIYPPGGFDVDAPLTQKDMAFLMMRVTGLDNQVINRLSGKGVGAESKAVIKKLEGTVEYKRDVRGEYAAAQLGDELFMNDSLKTGAGASVELLIGKFSAAQIGENTEIVIEDLSDVAETGRENVRIFLKQGDILLNVKEGTQKVNFETRTNTTVAGVVGTIYGMSSGDEDVTTSYQGTVSTYLIDEKGAPKTEPKPLTEGQKLTVGPQGDPLYDVLDPAERASMLNQGSGLQGYIPEGGESGQQSGADSGMSSYEARQQLSEGSDEALVAALDVLAEEGIVIETTGPAAAANTQITRTQLTQFLEDLLLDPVFRFNNVDITPIGQ